MLKLALLAAGLLADSARAACAVSPPGCADGTCAISWTDPTISAGFTKIKAVHVSELRDCVNWARGVSGLGAASWTNPTLSAGSTRVMATHFNELHSAINAVCQANGKPNPASAVSAGNPIRASHVSNLRSAVTTCLPTGPQVLTFYVTPGWSDEHLPYGYTTQNATYVKAQACRVSGTSCTNPQPNCSVPNGNEGYGQDMPGPQWGTATSKAMSYNPLTDGGGCSFNYRLKACDSSRCSGWAYVYNVSFQAAPTMTFSINNSPGSYSGPANQSVPFGFTTQNAAAGYVDVCRKAGTGCTNPAPICGSYMAAQPWGTGAYANYSGNYTANTDGGNCTFTYRYQACTAGKDRCSAWQSYDATYLPAITLMNVTPSVQNVGQNVTYGYQSTAANYVETRACVSGQCTAYTEWLYSSPDASHQHARCVFGEWRSPRWCTEAAQCWPMPYTVQEEYGGCTVSYQARACSNTASIGCGAWTGSATLTANCVAPYTNTCSAPTPACGQRTTGVNGCGQTCYKDGPACPPPPAMTSWWVESGAVGSPRSYGYNSSNADTVDVTGCVVSGSCSGASCGSPTPTGWGGPTSLSTSWTPTSYFAGCTYRYFFKPCKSGVCGAVQSTDASWW